MLKNWVKGGITRFVISTDQTQSQTGKFANVLLLYGI